MKSNSTSGHLSALLTIIIRGTTFISTKILLADFLPVEILFFRFVMGLAALPVPILRGSPEIIKQIRGKLYQPDFQDLTVMDFSDLAQSCKTYGEFIEKMGRVPESTLQYFDVAICGPKKKVNKLTGNIPLSQ